MKRILMIVGACVGTMVFLILVFLFQTTDAINAANYERIQEDMTLPEVVALLGSPGAEGNGDGHSFPMSWQGRGRNVITVHFGWRVQNGEVAHVVRSKELFNPSLWDRMKEWWGGYELQPGGGRSKRLESAA